MEHTDAAFTICPHCLEPVYTWEDQPVLSCQLSLPQFGGEGRAIRRMERYYRHLEQTLLRWLEAYHAQCCCLAQEALDASRPIPVHSVLVDYDVVYQDKRYLSLLWRLRSEGTLRRFPDLWDIVTGAPVRCKSLLPRKTARKVHRRDCLLTEQGILALGDQSDELIWSRTAS